MLRSRFILARISHSRVELNFRYRLLKGTCCLIGHRTEPHIRHSNSNLLVIMAGHHVLLTGPPGIGKTTVVKKLCELLKEKNMMYQGFFTEEVRNGRERIGFDIVSTFGKHGTLARVSIPNIRGPKVGKYTVDVSSFEALALPVFDCAPSSILILDEIGKMESFSKPFLSKTREAFAKDGIKILATIPVARNALPFVDELRNRKDCLLIQVTKENREDLPSEIVLHLLKT
ncbi:cancer-related nucleoside-triphosphatase homolog [Nephila pilipes]|uniref:Cancer-related nucleoside-triphosphatase homolog n=1 Tax=Nephila pilipes TaxID=299642 RepID=A0A8X6MR76_NEPPI|nr:cancer-related nucleoside-triphosphatase homolog [Nephila pilipes]